MTVSRESVNLVPTVNEVLCVEQDQRNMEGQRDQLSVKFLRIHTTSRTSPYKNSPA